MFLALRSLWASSKLNYMKNRIWLLGLPVCLIISAFSWAQSKGCKGGSKICQFEGEVIISPLGLSTPSKNYGMFICEAKCSAPRPLSGGELARFYELSKDQPASAAVWKTAVSHEKDARPLYEIVRSLIFDSKGTSTSQKMYQAAVEIQGSKKDLTEFGRLYLKHVKQSSQEPTLLDPKKAKVLHKEVTDPANSMVGCLVAGGSQSLSEGGAFCTCGTASQKFSNTIDYVCKNGRLNPISKEKDVGSPTPRPGPQQTQQ